MKSLNVIRDNHIEGTTYHNTITGEELVAFLIDRKICSNVDNAKKVGYKLQNLHALKPVYTDDHHDPDEVFAFEGDNELYHVDSHFLVTYYSAVELRIDGRKRRRRRRTCSRRTTAACCRSRGISRRSVRARERRER